MTFSILILFTIQILIYLVFIFFLKDKLFNNYNAVQKIHDGEIPRIGGLIFFLGFIYLVFFNSIAINEIITLLLGTSIIFIFSFYEDIKQNLSPLFRLIILFLGSSIFIISTEMPTINFRYLSFMNDYYFISFLIFTLSLMLLMNGFNFIDGLNGLSSFNFYSILSSVYYLSYQLGDQYLLALVSTLILSSLLAFLLNFPFGKIFLGDSGSYLYAFYSGAMIIYLFSRHEQLPTLLALVILAYPITEMLFSIIRKILRKKSPMEPDTMHIHHLIYLNISKNLKYRNSISSILMLPFSMSPFLLSYYAFNNPWVGEELLFIAYVFIYSLTYYLLGKKINV